MIYTYVCPICHITRSVPWSEWHQDRMCHMKRRIYLPPSPGFQHDAYVNTHDWPDAMAAVVYGIRGRMCTVPGCMRAGDTLDHRVPWSRGGRTSVANLYPMCIRHNELKGDQPYDEWLRTDLEAQLLAAFSTRTAPGRYHVAG
jgi:5-methylcytosine-specific restriction endonuclease McrA